MGDMRAAEVAASLTASQAAGLRDLPEDGGPKMMPAMYMGDLWREMFNLRLVSLGLAAGYRFACLSPFGQRVRAELTTTRGDAAARGGGDG